jgi:hypothetical protein
MNLHMTSGPEPQALWAISSLQQSVLRAMHPVQVGRHARRLGQFQA